MIYHSKSERETHKIAEDLAHKVANHKDPIVIALEGELGAGKTTFVRGFLRSLKVKEKVKSPTFVLMRHYKVPKTNKNIYHIDCYRVRDHRDLAILDLKAILNESHKGNFATLKSRKTQRYYATQASHNIVLIEWPERVSKILPKKLVRVHIDHIDQNKRKITIK